MRRLTLPGSKYTIDASEPNPNGDLALTMHSPKGAISFYDFGLVMAEIVDIFASTAKALDGPGVETLHFSIEFIETHPDGDGGVYYVFHLLAHPPGMTVPIRWMDDDEMVRLVQRWKGLRDGPQLAQPAPLAPRRGGVPQ